jgi:hypothetical protein
MHLDCELPQEYQTTKIGMFAIRKNSFSIGKVVASLQGKL